ncbi:hypothetical protein O181_013678 [Austropuccinia psidii MF-1]|uniref:DNA mismatch repair protein MSH3 n=1 Tax=Austropuccinia psidii MF-1 TaxID=1389203 RepID=A0A9Q3GNC2_9BASI|nr:hypothetical protein [Austropuccinia psidii MF-1]
MSETTTSVSRPRTTTEDANHEKNAELGSWIVALTESRGVGREVGIVGVELELATVVVSQLADSQTYVKTIHWLRQRPPCNLLFVAPASPNATTILHTSLKHLFPAVPRTVLPRSCFSDEKGYALLKDLASPGAQSVSTLSDIRKKYYALGAASAVIEWIQEGFIQTGHLGWGKNCLNVKSISVEGCMIIDRNSVTDLELINNVVSAKSKQSLLGLLNHTLTPMATRLLKSSLLAPSTEVEVIEARLDAVQELIEHEDCFVKLRKSLRLLAQIDIDKLISSVASIQLESSLDSASSATLTGASLISKSKAKRKVQNQDPSIRITKKLELLKSLKTLLQSLSHIQVALSGCSSGLLVLALSFLSDPALEELLIVIQEQVNEDSLLAIQKGGLAKQNIHAYAIKTGKNNRLLDVARETYKENLSDAISICEELKEQYHLPKMQFNFETRAGFMLHIKKDDLMASNGKWDTNKEGLPSVFTNIVKKGKSLHFTCLDLRKKNQLIANSYQEICLLSDQTLDEILEEFKHRISAFFRLSESISLIDMLASFAYVASTQQYVRPEFTDTLAISSGRHPIKERFDKEIDEFIPNDTYANESSSFQLITGPNMSGKSIFLRQIALMVVMAQIGSFCPVNYASFPIFNALLTCLSKNDDIEASLSTFSSEMKTMSGILSTLTVSTKALIIIDELGRGTSPLEGIGLAHAFSEEIIRAKAFCFFATHFRELSSTLSVYPNVVCLHLDTKLKNEGNAVKLEFPHKVLEGTTKQGGYGIELACLTALPADLISHAKKISAQIATATSEAEKSCRTNQVIKRRKLLLEVYTTLKNLAKHSKLSPTELKNFLIDFQTKTVERLYEYSNIENYKT